MGRVLAISSYVAHGHVGLGAIVPALQALGHDVMAVPSVVLSNHYGYAHCGGMTPSTADLGGMMDALQANGWLEEIDAVLTGYLPGVQHAVDIARIIDAMKEDIDDLIYVCDPVLGDDPDGLYVDDALAAAVGDDLLELADVITPNRFELAWLSDDVVVDPASAVIASDLLEVACVVATSVPTDDDGLANVLWTDEQTSMAACPQRKSVPHGTGDLFAALLLGHMLNGSELDGAMARATSGVDLVVQASLGAEELHLIETLQAAAAAPPASLEYL